MTFVAACRKFFGKKPDQGLADFGREIKELTPEDRAEMAPLLAETLGEEVTP